MFDSKELYQRLLPKLNALEKMRQNILVKKRNTQLVSVGIGVVVLILGLVLMGAAGPIFGFIMFGVGVLGIHFFYQQQVGNDIKTYRHLYKSEVISRIASEIEPGLKYSPDGGISKHQFKELGHYSNRIDRYASEDYFHGKLGETELYFAEIHAEYKTTSTDSDGDTSTTWHTLFEGVLFAADFHKDFNTWVTIKPDKESGMFGWIGKKIQKLSSSHIRMENPEFEEHFKVNAGDDQAARYLLTPDMQERLLGLKKNYGKNVIISLQNGYVYVTIPKSEDWFESSIYQSTVSEAQVRRIGMQIVYFLQLVKDLNLNTRIWAKE